MLVTLFENARASIGVAREIELSDLGPHNFDFPPETDKAVSLPAFSPAEFHPGTPRLKSNVVRVHALVLDLDDISTIQLRALVDRLDADGTAAAVYTTWSHTKCAPDLWRLRVVIPLAKPIPRDDWPRVWFRCHTYYGGISDIQCKDANRLYFGAFAPAGSDPSRATFVVFPGNPLDPDALPDVGGLTVPALLTKEKIGRDRLERLAARWLRSAVDYRSHMGHALRCVVRGEPFADVGQRDTTLFQLTADLAKEWPNADATSVAAHFAQSLQIMGPDAPTLAIVADKFARACEREREEAAEAESAEKAERRLRILQAWQPVQPGRDTPYTDAELDAYAEQAKCTRGEFRKRWVIQRGGQYYFFTVGRYSPPYGPDDAFNAAVRDLAPAVSAGVGLWDMTGKQPRRKSVAELMADYGSVATDYILDMRAQTASYDASQKLFTEAPCPVRKLRAEYVPNVARWLEILAGPHLPNLLIWIAHVTRLEDICAALLLTGAPGTGKSLLGLGLSRLYTEDGPTDLASVFSDFNESIARCPVVFADEQLPKDFKGHARTAELREFIASRSRPYKKKFAHETRILGAVRLLIAANNDEILAMNENLSANDIEAIGDRFYHIHVNPDAARFLRSVDTAEFIAGDGIARHALWLRENLRYESAGRFLIKSGDREFYRSLTTRSGIRSAVCQWLVGYLKDPRKIDLKAKYLVRVDSGRLLVNTQALAEDWTVYVTNETTPPTGRLSSALTGLSHPERVQLRRPGTGAPMYYRSVDVSHLHAWAEQTEFATREEIDGALRNDTIEQKPRGVVIPLRP